MGYHLLAPLMVNYNERRFVHESEQVRLIAELAALAEKIRDEHLRKTLLSKIMDLYNTQLL